MTGRKITWLASLVAVAALAAGCDVKPEPPRTADGQVVRTVAVNLEDAEEVAAVERLGEATVAYEHALMVLRAHYERIGALDEEMWATAELANLREAQTFTFAGVAAPPEPPPVSLEEANEAFLVEQVLSARKAWKQALADLEALYAEGGVGFKVAMVKSVQRRFDPVHAYSYILTAEVPPADLRPTVVAPEAEALFEEALKLHRQGKPLPAITSYPKQRRALEMFTRLIREHPNSTRIAESAYYIGYIYKEYFNENLRALKWLERAWQWDENLMLPARFEAAVVYDYRLGHRAKALELYRRVIREEQFNSSNVSFAAQRIKELTGPTGS
jgi:tetratricopeptide (TPR) repeat protein